MKFAKIFVSVGTTEFNELIEKISDPEVYDILKSHLGCKELTLQIGKGKDVEFDNFSEIKVNSFTLKQSIENDIDSSDLIISHAGAGTCIDVLSRNKPLIVVINDTLMNNHQIELAEQLYNEKFLFYSTVSALPETLKTFDVSQLRRYEKGNVDEFVKYLDDFMGFV
jgi:beta-1,4-N-acetylglucosaminyltransferase